MTDRKVRIFLKLSSQQYAIIVTTKEIMFVWQKR